MPTATEPAQSLLHQPVLVAAMISSSVTFLGIIITLIINEWSKGRQVNSDIRKAREINLHSRQMLAAEKEFEQIINMMSALKEIREVYLKAYKNGPQGKTAEELFDQRGPMEILEKFARDDFNPIRDLYLDSRIELPSELRELPRRAYLLRQYLDQQAAMPLEKSWHAITSLLAGLIDNSTLAIEVYERYADHIRKQIST